MVLNNLLIRLKSDESGKTIHSQTVLRQTPRGHLSPWVYTELDPYKEETCLKPPPKRKKNESESHSIGIFPKPLDDLSPYSSDNSIHLGSASKPLHPYAGTPATASQPGNSSLSVPRWEPPNPLETPISSVFPRDHTKGTQPAYTVSPANSITSCSRTSFPYHNPMGIRAQINFTFMFTSVKFNESPQISLTLTLLSLLPLPIRMILFVTDSFLGGSSLSLLRSRNYRRYRRHFLNFKKI